MKSVLCLYITLLQAIVSVQAQFQQPYILNGSATQRNCNCYVLTEEVQFTSGTIWNKNLIDLRQSFNYVFEVNLGCKDATGADGIGFILQTQGTNLGAAGQGIGFKGITPSLGIIIDTWMNNDENDPSYDHLSIQYNGVTDHLAPENLTAPVTVLDGQDNIEDCAWHLFRIEWDAATFTFTVSVDNQLRLTASKDLITEVFGGNPMVYWGFAGSTGGSTNVQQFCAALHPEFNFDGGQVFCDGTPITFRDNSTSFGAITRWYWDLGDGTTSRVPIPPAHLYAGAGLYEVKLVIEDNSGCISDTLKNMVTVGSYPEVKFGPDPLCLGDPLQLKDASVIKVGSPGTWNWDFGMGQFSNMRDPLAPFTTPGQYPVRLEVVSQEGCGSSAMQVVNVFNSPYISGTGRNACIGELNAFRGTNLTPGINIASWYWVLDGKDTVWQQNVDHLFPVGGKYGAELHAMSTDGCAADVIKTEVAVVDINVRAGRDTLIAKGQPLQLRGLADGEDLHYSWYPARGLNDPYIPAPVGTLYQDQEMRLTVTSPDGCVDVDTLYVKVYTGPEFYVPSGFTPNHDGVNDYFKVIAPGVPQLEFFKVWNRWGQLMFETHALSHPWDGNYNGQPAAGGTYVWMVQGVDYQGRRFSRQGTVTLIR